MQVDPPPGAADFQQAPAVAEGILAQAFRVATKAAAAAGLAVPCRRQQLAAREPQARAVPEPVVPRAATAPAVALRSRGTPRTAAPVESLACHPGRCPFRAGHTSRPGRLPMSATKARPRLIAHRSNFVGQRPHLSGATETMALRPVAATAPGVVAATALSVVVETPRNAVAGRYYPLDLMASSMKNGALTMNRQLDRSSAWQVASSVD